MKKIINTTHLKLYLLQLLCLFILLSINTLGQNKSSIEKMLPMKDIDQKLDKINTSVSNMGFTVHVNIYADLKNYDGCNSNSSTRRRLNIEIDWYDTNDETGKMMADMIKNDIQKTMKSFYSSSGFEDLKQAKEVEIKGGKMWIYSKTKECFNEITGPTGKTEHFTQIRAFIFTGNIILKIDLKSKSKPETLKQSLDFILKNLTSVDFKSL